MSNLKNSLKNALSKLETFLNIHLIKKAPSLPKEIKDFLVKYGPWILLLLLIIELFITFISITGYTLGLLFSFGSNSGEAPISYVFNYIFYLISPVLLLIIGFVGLFFEGLSIRPLIKREYIGWKYIFYSSLIFFILQITDFTIVSFIVSCLFIYIIFQIKDYYK